MDGNPLKDWLGRVRPDAHGPLAPLVARGRERWAALPPQRRAAVAGGALLVLLATLMASHRDRGPWIRADQIVWPVGTDRWKDELTAAINGLMRDNPECRAGFDPRSLIFRKDTMDGPVVQAVCRGGATIVTDVAAADAGRPDMTLPPMVRRGSARSTCQSWITTQGADEQGYQPNSVQLDPSANWRVIERTGLQQTDVAIGFNATTSSATMRELGLTRPMTRRYTATCIFDSDGGLFFVEVKHD